MALIRIEIEQVNARQFNAHVEVGFPQSRRKGPSEGLRFGTLAEAFKATWDTVHELGKEEVPSLLLGPPFAAMVTLDDVGPPAELEPPPGEIDALRADAEAAGIKVDRRWGEARLREEIEKAGAHE